MGKTANKQIICEVLMEAAKEDKDIVAVAMDDRTVPRKRNGTACMD